MRFFDLSHRVLNICLMIFQYSWYNLRLAHLGWRSVIESPLKINGTRNIHIDRNVRIAYKTWLAAMPYTGDKARLCIEAGTRIGHFNHIYATQSILIEKNVLTADKVYISDNIHSYTNIDLPIKDQPILQKKAVVIGEDSWLGENVCVIGACIGKHCVIGANSVVTKDIPDYCVAVGAPARIIKRYNFTTNTWQRTNPDGSFIKQE